MVRVLHPRSKYKQPKLTCKNKRFLDVIKKVLLAAALMLAAPLSANEFKINGNDFNQYI